MTVQARLAPATDRKGLSGPALRTFLRIAESWELSVDEQMILLGVTAASMRPSSPTTPPPPIPSSWP